MTPSSSESTLLKAGVAVVAAGLAAVAAATSGYLRSRRNRERLLVADTMEWKDIRYKITTDKEQFDVQLIQEFLCDSSYWAKGIPLEVVRRSIDGSIGFAVLDQHGAQVGFARVISDKATFAYMADLFILPEARGRGLGKWLVKTILKHSEFQGLRTWTLFTADAHGLYQQSGFEVHRSPERFMSFSDFKGYD